MIRFFKRIYLYLLSIRNPIRYAKKIGVTVGDDCLILSKYFGSEPWLIEIGNHVEITSGVRFINHDGATWVIRNEEKAKNVIKYGRIRILDNSFIGINSILLPGITIGPNSIVAAGSIVTKDVPPNTVVGGNPAKIISTISQYTEKCIKNCQEYDYDNYKRDKKEELLRILNK